MVDLGHAQTDKVLEDLEERLGRVYAKAYDDVRKKADDYFARFAVKDKAKKDLVNAGKLSKEAYYTWRNNQMLSGKRWTDLRDQLATDLTNANVVASGMVRGELYGVFAINANYSEYLIENGMRVNYGFTLYDRRTVENLVRNDPDIIPWKPDVDIPADLRWNRQMVTSHITQGILQGESIPHLSKRLLKTVNNDRVAAVRTARTAVTSAQNAGRQAVYDKAKSMGINLQKEWLATLDGRTRHDHGMADGQRVALDGKFVVGGYKMEYPGDMSAPGWLVYNCRCTTITVEPDYITKGEEPRKTYDEWIAEKGGKEYEKYQGKKAQVQKAMAKQEETYSTFADGEQASEFFGQRPPRSLRRENREEYDRLMEQYRNSSFGSWHDGLSGEETASIAEYSGDGYSGINGLLRGHMTEKMVKAWDDVSSMGIREMVDHLDDSISRFELKKGIKVYRTCEKNVFDNLSKQVGSKFVDDGFVSTTVLNKKVASGNVFMEIDVPPGTGRGAWINPLSGSADEEWEFLLQRGSVFEITDVSDVGDDIVVKMKWTGIEKKDIEFASREDVIAWQKKNGLYDETEEYRI